MESIDNSLCRVFKFIPVLKDYDWGSPYSIQKITGNKELEGKPVAELWIGSHPKGEGSVIDSEGNAVRISRFIEKNSSAVLGSRCSKKYGGKLPFLFKIIAAERALSIQVHPAKYEAEKGFADEEKRKIDINSSSRNYKDRNHKPELIYALTDFSLMKGFRNGEDICRDVEKYAPLLGEREKDKSGKRCGKQNFLTNTSGISSPDSVRDLFAVLLLSDKTALKKMIDQTLQKCTESNGPIEKAINLLFEIYGYDCGVLSPLFLNLMELRPGEALFIPAGELHAYIKGTGFEVMASSDNVIRGGLTKKHVDTSLLLEITEFSPSDTETLRPYKSHTETIFVTPADEFVFSVISLESGNFTSSGSEKSIELFFFTGEQCSVKTADKEQAYLFNNGDSFLIPACTDNYTIKGKGCLYRASVNI